MKFCSDVARKEPGSACTSTFNALKSPWPFGGRNTWMLWTPRLGSSPQQENAQAPKTMDGAIQQRNALLNWHSHGLSLFAKMPPRREGRGGLVFKRLLSPVHLFLYFTNGEIAGQDTTCCEGGAGAVFQFHLFLYYRWHPALLLWTLTGSASSIPCYVKSNHKVHRDGATGRKGKGKSFAFPPDAPSPASGITQSTSSLRSWSMTCEENKWIGIHNPSQLLPFTGVKSHKTVPILRPRPHASRYKPQLGYNQAGCHLLRRRSLNWVQFKFLILNRCHLDWL